MFELRIVRERRTGYGRMRPIHNSSEVFAAFQLRAERTEREEFLALPLDSKNQPLGFYVVSVGSLGASLVHPRETFKIAIIANAASLIVLHNHPSGDPTPSLEDVRITDRLKAAGELLGVPLLDHIIIGEDDFYSFADAGWRHGETQANGGV